MNDTIDMLHETISPSAGQTGPAVEAGTAGDWRWVQASVWKMFRFYLFLSVSLCFTFSGIFLYDDGPDSDRQDCFTCFTCFEIEY